jgi:hypothetical protein
VAPPAVLLDESFEHADATSASAASAIVARPRYLI